MEKAGVTSPGPALHSRATLVPTQPSEPLCMGMALSLLQCGWGFCELRVPTSAVGGVMRLLLWFRRWKRMVGPYPSPWAKVLLAALLSISLLGNTGESLPCPLG